MKLPRTLDQLQRDTERYVHGARAGRKDRLLSASLFDQSDKIQDGADCEQAKEIAAKIAAETEALIRLAHAADSADFYAAWTRQREAVAELRSTIASE